MKSTKRIFLSWGRGVRQSTTFQRILGKMRPSSRCLLRRSLKRSLCFLSCLLLASLSFSLSSLSFFSSSLQSQRRWVQARNRMKSYKLFMFSYKSNKSNRSNVNFHKYSRLEAICIFPTHFSAEDSAVLANGDDAVRSIENACLWSTVPQI